MRRPPFDRLPDLDNVFHTEQYSLLLDHLAKSTIQSDFLVAICGADGCGKTTLLNRFLFSLDNDVCVARLDETYKGVRDFYCAILRQLGFSDIDGKPEELRRITREFFINRGMASEPVLLVIDNAHLMSPFILEQLRWLSAIKVDEVRVLSCILAGNSDLMRIMDSSAMSQFSFNNYIRFHIRAYSETETMNYVWSRLKFAGCSDSLSIADEAQPLIHRFSGGIPRLINILCDAVLVEACSLESTKITEEMLRNVAEHRHLVPHVLPYSGKGRRQSDPDFDSSCFATKAVDATATPSDVDGSNMAGEAPCDIENVDEEKLWAAGETSGLRQQISRLSKKLAELKGENSRFLKQIDSRDNDIRKLEEALQSQVSRYTKLEEAFGNKSGAYEQLSASMIEQMRALERSEESNRNLVDTIRQDQQVLADLRTKLSTANADRETIAKLRSETNELRRQLAEADQDKETISSLEQKTCELLKELETAEHNKEETARLEQETEDLRNKLDAAATDKETIARLERETGELQEQLDRARADNEKISALQRESAELRENLAKAAGDKETIDSLRRELDGLHARLADAAGDKQVMEDLQGELRELRERHGAGDEQIAQLQSELSDALEALGYVEDELATTHHVADELRQQVETREAEVEQITAVASDLEAVVDAHDQEVAVLQLRIDELESEQLATADRLTQFDSLEAYANDCDLQIRALQSQLEAAQQRRVPHTGDTHKSTEHTSTGAESNADETTMVKPLGPAHVPIRTIEVFRGDSLDHILRVSEGQKRIMIGRDSDNELVLDSNFISRHHAILSFRDDGSACIEDLHSTNGVVVNKTKLASSELAVGDVVILGDFCLLPGPA